MEALTRLQLLTLTHPTPSCLPTLIYMSISVTTVTVRKVAQNPPVLAS